MAPRPGNPAGKTAPLPERSGGAQPPGASEVSEAREPRGARRKRETREKLLQAAYRLFGERGVDAVAINEITEAADVGFGSFYNHFASKEAIYDAVVDSVFGAFGDTLTRLTSDVEDPAEVVAICVRHTILRARAEPLWGRFFLREGFKPSAMTRGLGARLFRDVQRGVAAKRFDTPDVLMAVMLAGGCVLSTVAAQSAMPGQGARAKELGLDMKDLPSRAAAAILEALGLTRAEAQKLAARPLPPIASARSA
jgi:AcrR family transcriptional regulator